MLPERRRLEVNLFEEIPLRSSIGMQVVQDLLALYLRDKEVEFRPGLEPSRCSCSQSSHGYDWRHILECHKASQTYIYGFAELFFLCNSWVYDKNKWEKHCQWHIDNIATFPVWIDPLMYDGVLAVAGFCEFCVINSRLPASDRMHQFTWRHHWQDYYERHFHDLKFERKCRHQSFDSDIELRFHLQDCSSSRLPWCSHAELSRQKKRRKQQEQEGPKPPARINKRRKTIREEEQDQNCGFSTAQSIRLP